MGASKIAVGLVAYRRTNYLKQATDALFACQGFDKVVNEVICSVDDVKRAGTACFEQLVALMGSMDINMSVYGQPTLRGIVGNTILTMKMAFDHGAENVLMLEDDAVLKPDALRMAQWFCDQRFPNVVGFGLSAHGEKGGIKDDEHPRSLCEYNFLPCPFAYVVQRRHWKFLLDSWCCKEHHPCGWSWSMTYAARFAGLRFMAPWLSRCENVGREDGTNESPASWDLTQKGITFSDGSYWGPYRVVKGLEESQIRKVDEWMVPEMEKQVNAKYDAWLNFGCPPEITMARENMK